MVLVAVAGPVQAEKKECKEEKQALEDAKSARKKALESINLKTTDPEERKKNLSKLQEVNKDLLKKTKAYNDCIAEQKANIGIGKPKPESPKITGPNFTDGKPKPNKPEAPLTPSENDKRCDPELQAYTDALKGFTGSQKAIENDASKSQSQKDLELAELKKDLNDKKVAFEDCLKKYKPKIISPPKNDPGTTPKPGPALGKLPHDIPDPIEENNNEECRDMKAELVKLREEEAELLKQMSTKEGIEGLRDLKGQLTKPGDKKLRADNLKKLLQIRVKIQKLWEKYKKDCLTAKPKDEAEANKSSCASAEILSNNTVHEMLSLNLHRIYKGYAKVKTDTIWNLIAICDSETINYQLANSDYPSINTELSSLELMKAESITKVCAKFPLNINRWSTSNHNKAKKIALHINDKLLSHLFNVSSWKSENCSPLSIVPTVVPIPINPSIPTSMPTVTIPPSPSPIATEISTPTPIVMFTPAPQAEPTELAEPN